MIQRYLILYGHLAWQVMGMIHFCGYEILFRKNSKQSGFVTVTIVTMKYDLYHVSGLKQPSPFRYKKRLPGQPFYDQFCCIISVCPQPGKRSPSQLYKSPL